MHALVAAEGRGGGGADGKASFQGEGEGGAFKRGVLRSGGGGEGVVGGSSKRRGEPGGGLDLTLPEATRWPLSPLGLSFYRVLNLPVKR